MGKTPSRRRALKAAVLMAIGMALGKMDTLKASGGELRVPLDQWQSVVFEHHGKRIVVSVGEIFRALEESTG